MDRPLRTIPGPTETALQAARSEAIADLRPTGELIKQALEDARSLVRIEVGLAKEEARDQLKSTSRAAIAGGIAFVSALLFLSSATMTVVLAWTVPRASVIAAAFSCFYLVSACIAGAVAYRLVPKKPAAETRRRIEDEIKELKEHIA